MEKETIEKIEFYSKLLDNLDRLYGKGVITFEDYTSIINAVKAELKELLSVKKEETPKEEKVEEKKETQGAEVKEEVEGKTE
jgi:hypothetical protein